MMVQIELYMNHADKDWQSDVRGGNSQLPPSALQSAETHKSVIGLERPGLPTEVGRVAGFLASGFSSYVTGSNLVVDGGAT
jgi:NAD(P)-dependent dehydrogenase (short-subunit alcohol dehydrogenase family)